MIGGGLNQRPFKRVFDVTIGTAQGQVNMVHNLSTEEFTWTIRQKITGNVIFAPLFSVDADTAAIDINGADKDVIITIHG